MDNETKKRRTSTCLVVLVESGTAHMKYLMARLTRRIDFIKTVFVVTDQQVLYVNDKLHEIKLHISKHRL